MPGTREWGIARGRMKPGGACQRSPSSSVIYSLLVSPLSRSCIFTNKWESSFCRFISSCGLRSRPAIRCTMVEYRPRCSPWLGAVSADVAVSWVGDIGAGVPWFFCFLVRVRGGGVRRCWGWYLSWWRRRWELSRLLGCWRMVKHSLFPLPSYHQCYNRGEVRLRCRILEFLLYRRFVYTPILVADAVGEFT